MNLLVAFPKLFHKAFVTTSRILDRRIVTTTLADYKGHSVKNMVRGTHLDRLGNSEKLKQLSQVVNSDMNSKTSIIEDCILLDFKHQIHTPDTKSDCGIFACAMADSFSAFTVEELLRCPSDRLKARYHITDGGGDGGGIIAQSSPDEVAKFYGCDVRFFKGDGRLLQFSFSREDQKRAVQYFDI
ncbi:MAG: hypothetical protein VW397_03250, partial [Candidatus Margulisiibacteriota bacterium]